MLGLSYTSALCLAKLTLLTFYLRIVSARPLRYTIYFLMGFVVSYTVLGNFVNFLELSPTLGPALLRTADKPITILYAACNILSDLCILLLPLRIILPLEMNRTMKISILSLFSAGALWVHPFPPLSPLESRSSNEGEGLTDPWRRVCAAAIWRATTITFNMTDDAHGDATPFAVEMCVTFAECNGAIICAAIPATTKFLAQYLAQSVARYLGGLKSTILYRGPSLPTSEPRRPRAPG